MHSMYEARGYVAVLPASINNSMWLDAPAMCYLVFWQGGEVSLEVRAQGCNLAGIADQWELAGEVGHRSSRNLLAGWRLPRAGGTDYMVSGRAGNYMHAVASSQNGAQVTCKADALCMFPAPSLLTQGTHTNLWAPEWLLCGAPLIRLGETIPTSWVTHNSSLLCSTLCRVQPFVRVFQLTNNQQLLSSWTEALRGLRAGVNK